VIDPAPLIEHDQDEAEARALAAPTAESDAERQARITWEAEGIAKARASIAAGYYATEAEVDAWIDSLGTDHPLPVPYPRQPRPL
jgi:predicted transcriptional regulator